MKKQDTSMNLFLGVVGFLSLITIEAYFVWAENHVPEFYQLVLGFGVGCVSFIVWFGVLFGILSAIAHLTKPAPDASPSGSQSDKL